MIPRHGRLVSLPKLCATGCLLLLAAGCGGDAARVAPCCGPVPPPPDGYAGVAFTGTVLGGTTPIAGASVMLYSMGMTGNGSAPTPLLSAALPTDAAGVFSVAAGYRCASSGSQIYLVARGGTLSTGQSSNPGIALLLALGSCGAINSGAKVTVSERTTIAGVWSLAQFLGPGGALGASTTNAMGLSNAVATGQALAGAVAGEAPGGGFAANATAPVAKIDALAGLLHLCVADAASAGCSSLLSLSTPPGGSAPADVLDAARNIALHAGNNVAALYALLPGGAPGTAALAAAPADWTLSVTYTGGGLHAPTALGVDSRGDVWVANYFGVLSEFSPTGVPAFASGITGSGLNSSYGLAIDAGDNVWVSNENSDGAINSARGSVAKFSGTAQPLSGVAGFSAGGLNYPIGMAIDPNGTVWVVNYGNTTVTLLDGSGNPLSGTAGYPVTGSAFPVAVALDAAHNGWIGDQNDGTVARVSADGKQITTFGCCNGSAGLAIDQAGTTWVANFYGGSVAAIAGGHTTTFSGGGLSRPQGIAIDGAGRVWVANYGAAALTELAGSSDPQPGVVLSPAAGWVADGTPSGAFAAGIDASGNLWISGFDRDVLTEVIGLVAPVKTPLLGPPQAP